MHTTSTYEELENLADGVNVDAVALDQAHVGRQHTVAFGICGGAKRDTQAVEALQHNLQGSSGETRARQRTDEPARRPGRTRPGQRGAARRAAPVQKKGARASTRRRHGRSATRTVAGSPESGRTTSTPPFSPRLMTAFLSCLPQSSVQAFLLRGEREGRFVRPWARRQETRGGAALRPALASPLHSGHAAH